MCKHAYLRVTKLRAYLLAKKRNSRFLYVTYVLMILIKFENLNENLIANNNKIDKIMTFLNPKYKK